MVRSLSSVDTSYFWGAGEAYAATVLELRADRRLPSPAESARTASELVRACRLFGAAGRLARDAYLAGYYYTVYTSAGGDHA